jgi:alpha-N-arabinofuranosidase
VLVDSPVYSCADYDAVPIIDTAAVLGDDNSVTVFVVSRDLKEDCLLDLDLRAFGKLRLKEHILLHHTDVKAVNTEEHPDTVVPAMGPGGTVDGGKAQIRVPALSWNVLRFAR